jgi:hypothetical protein
MSDIEQRAIFAMGCMVGLITGVAFCFLCYALAVWKP